MYKPALIAGIIFSGLAVVLGAFGAHSLKEFLTPAQLAIFEKGVTYQTTHGLALIAAAIVYQSFNHKAVKWAAYLFVAGIVLFSGSLYVLVSLQHSGRSIGAAGIATPIGGLCFVGGWLAMLVGIVNKK